jgi:uncharacterized protein (DUF1778 family)
MTEKTTKKTRLNLRIPSDLLEWAKGYAKLKNTNVTQLIVDQLTEKQDRWLNKEAHRG